MYVCMYVGVGVNVILDLLDTIQRGYRHVPAKAPRSPRALQLTWYNV